MSLYRFRAPMHFMSVTLFFILSAFIGLATSSKESQAQPVQEDVRIERLSAWISKKNPTAPAKRIAKAILDNADINGIDPYIIATHIEIESSFNPSATGEAGERGLMQMSKGAADRCNLDWQMAYDIEENVRGGSCYIAIHLKTYRGNVNKAAYRYNGGGDPNYVEKFNKRYHAMVTFISPDRIVVVKTGDTLSNLSAKFYGNKDGWKIIAKVNNIEDPDQIVVGQKITIPSKHSASMVASSTD